MERELINQKYLQELLEVAQDQEEDDLVSQMYERLRIARDQFLLHASDYCEQDPDKLKFELHKLKNQFANLGCEAVTELLENMYQLAKTGQSLEVRNSISSLHQLSEITFKELQYELSH